jgi:chromosome segregation ATPase
MACDECAQWRIELSEAKMTVAHLERVIERGKERRSELESHYAKASAMLTEARAMIDVAKEQNQKTKAMLERLRTYASSDLPHDE